MTSADVRMVAPASRAARSSSPDTAPIPPTGTSQSPVPPPIRWYRKQMFCCRSSSPARAKVPIRASVSTTPRTRSCWSSLAMCPRWAVRSWRPTASAPGPGPRGPRLGAGRQRRGHGGPEGLGESAAAGVELGKGLEFAVGRPDRGKGRRGGRGIPVSTSRAAPPSAGRGCRTNTAAGPAGCAGPGRR